MAISTRWSPSPVTRPAHSPSTMARPSRSRPSSRKNSIVASRSSTTMPTLSIRLSATCPISLLDARSAGEHRPADVVPQPLVVKHQLADLLWKLLALPPALDSPCTLSLVFRRGGTHGLDRIGGRTELVRGDVRDDRALASRVRGMPWCAAQVSRGGLGLSGRFARLHHLHLTTHPSAGMLDRHTRSSIVGLSRLEQAEDVLRARCRPESEEVVMRLGERPTATRRHEAGVSDLREDHRRQSRARNRFDKVGERAPAAARRLRASAGRWATTAIEGR